MRILQKALGVSLAAVMLLVSQQATTAQFCGTGFGFGMIPTPSFGYSSGFGLSPWGYSGYSSPFCGGFPFYRSGWYSQQTVIMDDYATGNFYDQKCNLGVGENPADRVVRLVPALKNVEHLDPDKIYETAPVGSLDSVLSSLSSNKDAPNAAPPAPPAATGPDHYKSVVNQCTEALKSNPNDAKSYFNRGLANIHLQNYKQSVADLTDALERNWNKVDCHYNRAYANFLLGEDAKVIADCTEAMKSEPNSKRCSYQRGLSEIRLGDWARAIADFDTVLKLDPQCARCYLYKATACHRLGKLDDALVSINKGIGLDATLPGCQLLKSIVLMDKGQMTDAMTALAKEPQSAQVLSQKALINFRQNKMADALAACKAALKLDANSVPTLMIRALAAFQTGDYGGAIADYDRVLALSPNSAEATLGKADLMLHLQLCKSAIMTLTKLIATAPSADAYERRALCYFRDSDFGKCVADCDAALRLNPGNRQCLYYRTIARLMSKQYAEAAADGENLIKTVGWQDPLSRYVVLSAWLSYKMAHKDKEAAALLATAELKLKKEWPYNVVLYLAGKQKADALLALTDPQQLTLARTYIGFNLQLAGQAAAARTHFEWVRKNGQVGTIEHRLAMAQLNAPRIGAPVTPGNRYALVVGISKFRQESNNLKFADKDATDFYNFLLSTGAYKKENVRLLTNQQGTRENIMSLLGDTWLPRVTQPNDIVVVYLSTHGSPSALDVRGLNYLVAYDTLPSKLYSTGLPVQDIGRLIKERIPAKQVIVVLDACHSGAAQTAGQTGNGATASGTMSAGDGGTAARAGDGGKALVRVPIAPDENIDPVDLATAGQIVVCSSEPDQVSWESKRYQNSVFTHHLMQALAKKTPLPEAFPVVRNGVKTEVESDRHAPQTPVLKVHGTSDVRLIP